MVPFSKGAIVHHKIMGKGLALNEVEENNEKKIEVRMENGHIEKFYPEELESDEIVKARQEEILNKALQANQERAKKMREKYGL